jgi:hypothetical protein
VLHYSYGFEVGDWKFDKRHYMTFDVSRCPPWPDMAAGGGAKPTHGILAPPPHPNLLPTNQVGMR